MSEQDENTTTTDSPNLEEQTEHERIEAAIRFAEDDVDLTNPNSETFEEPTKKSESTEEQEGDVETEPKGSRAAYFAEKTRQEMENRALKQRLKELEARTPEALDVDKIVDDWVKKNLEGDEEEQEIPAEQLHLETKQEIQELKQQLAKEKEAALEQSVLRTVSHLVESDEDLELIGVLGKQKMVIEYAKQYYKQSGGQAPELEDVARAVEMDLENALAESLGVALKSKKVREYLLRNLKQEQTEPAAPKQEQTKAPTLSSSYTNSESSDRDLTEEEALAAAIALVNKSKDIFQ